VWRALRVSTRAFVVGCCDPESASRCVCAVSMVARVDRTMRVEFNVFMCVIYVRGADASHTT